MVVVKEGLLYILWSDDDQASVGSDRTGPVCVVALRKS